MGRLIARRAIEVSPPPLWIVEGLRTPRGRSPRRGTPDGQTGNDSKPHGDGVRAAEPSILSHAFLRDAPHGPTILDFEYLGLAVRGEPHSRSYHGGPGVGVLADLRRTCRGMVREPALFSRLFGACIRRALIVDQARQHAKDATAAKLVGIAFFDRGECHAFGSGLFLFRLA